jgi:hypothetical protein
MYNKLYGCHKIKAYIVIEKSILGKGINSSVVH